MKEKQLLKLQKQRHMSNIFIMLLNNHLFKNLSERDQRKMAALIYKAEMIEMNVRNKQIIRVNQSFQDIVDALNSAMDFDLDDGLDDDEEDFGPNR
jgi:hypothetical protein